MFKLAKVAKILMNQTPNVKVRSEFGCISIMRRPETCLIGTRDAEVSNTSDESMHFHQRDGLPPDASLIELRRAYLLLCIIYHPDKLTETASSPIHSINDISEDFSIWYPPSCDTPIVSSIPTASSLFFLVDESPVRMLKSSSSVSEVSTVRADTASGDESELDSSFRHTHPEVWWRFGMS